MLLTTENVWDTFNLRLKQFILKRVPDGQSAEDILQDVFLKIHMHIRTLKDEEKFQGWMYQIARNAIYDYYRQKFETTSDIPEMPYIPEDMLDEDVVQELAPCIREMINQLPPHYKQAIILTEYEGLTQRELAERLDLSFSGAKSRVQRAREKLKMMLLDCCHFQFDRLGKVIDYQSRRDCCSGQDGCIQV